MTLPSSRARARRSFRLFESPPAEVSLTVKESPARSASRDKAQRAEPPKPRSISLVPAGKTLTAELDLTKNLTYRIEARSSDGRVLPKTEYRISVREDRSALASPSTRLTRRSRCTRSPRCSTACASATTSDCARRGSSSAPTTETNRRCSSRISLRRLRQTPNLRRARGNAALGDARADAHAERDLLRVRRGQLPRWSAADRDRASRFIDIRPFKREYKMSDPMRRRGRPDGLHHARGADRSPAVQPEPDRSPGKAQADRPGRARDPIKIAGFEETLSRGSRR